MEIKKVTIETDYGTSDVIVHTSPDYLQVGCSVALIRSSESVMEVARVIVRAMKAAID